MYRERRSSLAEEALNQLLDAQLQVGHTYDALKAQKPRLRAPTSRDARMATEEYAVGRCISVIEVYMNSWFEALMAAEFPTRSTNLEAMIENLEKSSSANWDSREETYRKYQSISLKDCVDYRTVRAANELRNSLAHRLGELTSRQRHSREIVRQLGVIEVVLHSGRVLMTKRTLPIIQGACRAFVDWLDEICIARIS